MVNSNEELQEFQYDITSIRNRDKIEASLIQLQALKSKVAKLRNQCELLRNMQVKCQNEIVICSNCGKNIESDQKITVKDNSGKPRSHFHSECFKTIWTSQTWKFDYASPGFLRRVK